MKSVYPFQTVRSAINFYLNHNPARQKYQNHAEPENDSADAVADKMGGSPYDIWAATTLALNAVLKGASQDQYWAFMYRYIMPPEPPSKENPVTMDGSWESIAKHMRMPSRRVKVCVRQLEDELFHQMKRRELIDPELEETIIHFPKPVKLYH